MVNFISPMEPSGLLTTNMDHAIKNNVDLSPEPSLNRYNRDFRNT